jgi:hypothetical protein
MDKRSLYLQMASERIAEMLKWINYRLLNKDYDRALVDLLGELRDLADVIEKMVQTAGELAP